MPKEMQDLARRLDAVRALVENPSHWTTETDIRTTVQLALLSILNAIEDLSEEIRISSEFRDWARGWMRAPVRDMQPLEARETLEELLRVEAELQVRIEAAKRSAAA